MYVKNHGLQKLKIRLYAKLVSSLIDFSLFRHSSPLPNIYLLQTFLEDIDSVFQFLFRLSTSYLSVFLRLELKHLLYLP